MYEVNRTQLLDKYGSTPCMIDSECTIAPETNRCVARCGVPLPKATAQFWVQNSTSFADSYCSACPPMPPPPCVFSYPRCIAGKCTAGPPPL